MSRTCTGGPRGGHGISDISRPGRLAHRNTMGAPDTPSSTTPASPALSAFDAATPTGTTPDEVVDDLTPPTTAASSPDSTEADGESAPETAARPGGGGLYNLVTAAHKAASALYGRAWTYADECVTVGVTVVPSLLQAAGAATGNDTVAKIAGVAAAGPGAQQAVTAAYNAARIRLRPAFPHAAPNLPQGAAGLCAVVFNTALPFATDRTVKFALTVSATFAAAAGTIAGGHPPDAYAGPLVPPTHSADGTPGSGLAVASGQGDTGAVALRSLPSDEDPARPLPSPLHGTNAAGFLPVVPRSVPIPTEPPSAVSPADPRPGSPLVPLSGASTHR
ncbi:hypothetical protein [Streptomyces sp. NPDC047061]|uniref:hypothetical protein n=1 Tax=Streptomyces sp. NPDC047061 TaxID=3154605 RepID=UPI003405F97E